MIRYIRAISIRLLKGRNYSKIHKNNKLTKLEALGIYQSWSTIQIIYSLKVIALEYINTELVNTLEPILQKFI